MPTKTLATLPTIQAGRHLQCRPTDKKGFQAGRHLQWRHTDKKGFVIRSDK
jgi:hypothetical protein